MCRVGRLRERCGFCSSSSLPSFVADTRGGVIARSSSSCVCEREMLAVCLWVIVWGVTVCLFVWLFKPSLLAASLSQLVLQQQRQRGAHQLAILAIAAAAAAAGAVVRDREMQLSPSSSRRQSRPYFSRDFSGEQLDHPL